MRYISFKHIILIIVLLFRHYTEYKFTYLKITRLFPISNTKESCRQRVYVHDLFLKILFFLLILICCLVFQKCEVSNILKNVSASLFWFYLNWVCGIWTFCFWEWPLSLTMKKLFYQLNVFLTHTYDLSFFFWDIWVIVFILLY